MTTAEAKQPPLRKRLIPFWSLLRREIQRFQKVLVQTVVTPLINSCLYLLIFGVSIGSRLGMNHGLSYLEFLIPGLVMMGCLNNSFQNSSSSIVSSKFTGDLEDYKVSLLTSQQIVWAMSLGGLFRGLVVGSITFVVGDLFLYMTQSKFIAFSHPLQALYFLVVGGLAFAQMGIAVAFWAQSFDQLSAVTSFLLLPLLYLGGVFFSIESLHPFWRSVAELNPLLYLINGVRYGLVGASDVDVWKAALIAAFFLIMMFVVSVRTLNRSSFSRW
jgi:ABC-2 type transport system permease protein